MKTTVMTTMAILALSAGHAMAQQQCFKEIPCPGQAQAPAEKVAVKVESRIDKLFSERPVYQIKQGLFYLQCKQDTDDKVCCYAKQNDHEWVNGGKQPWRFTPKNEDKSIASDWINSQEGLVCKSVGHVNLGKLTNTGRHMIARFHWPQE